MIKDSIKNIEQYFGLSERFKLGLEYLKDADWSEIEDGRHELLGSEVYVNVQKYLSKYPSDAEFEAHKKYVDIQYIINGSEKIEVCDAEHFSPLSDYDIEKDIIFLLPKESSSPEFFTLCADEFLILMPGEVHKPSLAVDVPINVRKAVVKVLF